MGAAAQLQRIGAPITALARAVERAVWGMLPKNRLSRQLIGKLKVYAGPEHPHAAQTPQAYEITQIAQ